MTDLLRLGQASRRTIDEAWKAGGRTFLSSVSVWEIAVLVDKGFIELDLPANEWVDWFLDRPGLEAVAQDHAAAAHACSLHHLEHRDPADRLLVASGRQYRFSVA